MSGDDHIEVKVTLRIPRAELRRLVREEVKALTRERVLYRGPDDDNRHSPDNGTTGNGGPS